ncbi:patatin-like phospholipase family protein [Thiomonas sp. FB-Cd]|uniref:patatin-like phospholipase family protein n=1 Tax=Thiomonas sp. FB-Cd TaxID=1158292 RepID=UPI0004DFC3D6
MAGRKVERPKLPGQVVLVLQGGGALGAYQAGVYQALSEAGIEPDWVIGTSIGAVNGAIIAGSVASERLQRLKAFWRAVSHGGWPRFTGSWSRLESVLQGVPGFFHPNPAAWLYPDIELGEEAAGYYRADALRKTLGGLVDTQQLSTGTMRLTLGAVNVRSGQVRYFDSRDEPITLDHVLASGALPPAFAPVRIGEELYWDGGIASNTPIEAVFDDRQRHDARIFAVQVWNPHGEAPTTMRQVFARHKDIQFASRADSHVMRPKQLHMMRHIIRQLAQCMSPAQRARKDVAEMLDYGCGTTMRIVKLLSPALAGDDHTKDLDFTPEGIEARWQAGHADTQRALLAEPWLKPVDPIEGVAVYDVSLLQPQSAAA